MKAITTIKKAAALGAVAFFMLSSQGVVAEPKVTVKNVYYEIAGQTGRVLRDQMRQLGPKSRWAKTKWHVRWSSSCKVTVAITYIYPRLADRQSMPVETLKNWDEMMFALVQHEEGHTAITVKAATKIESLDCAHASKIFKEGNRLNKVYDIETDHGRNRGVTLAD